MHVEFPAWNRKELRRRASIGQLTEADKLRLRTPQVSAKKKLVGEEKERADEQRDIRAVELREQIGVVHNNGQRRRYQKELRKLYA